MKVGARLDRAPSTEDLSTFGLTPTTPPPTITAGSGDDDGDSPPSSPPSPPPPPPQNDDDGEPPVITTSALTVHLMNGSLENSGDSASSGNSRPSPSTPSRDIVVLRSAEKRAPHGAGVADLSLVPIKMSTLTPTSDAADADDAVGHAANSPEPFA